MPRVEHQLKALLIKLAIQRVGADDGSRSPFTDKHNRLSGLQISRTDKDEPG